MKKYIDFFSIDFIQKNKNRTKEINNYTIIVIEEFIFTRLDDILKNKRTLWENTWLNENQYNKATINNNNHDSMLVIIIIIIIELKKRISLSLSLCLWWTCLTSDKHK